jgi:ActD protein
VHAAEKVRDAGYSKWDTHTPFPVHGMDRAMALKDSRLGWIVLGAALTGLTAAFAMMHWMNGVDYPIVVDDKPPGAPFWTGDPGSLPSMVPILFELTILFSAFGAVLGMLHLNGLPRHHHPVFESDRFRLASDDRFFLSIDAEDPKFDVDETKTLLEEAHAENVELIEEEAS